MLFNPIPSSKIKEIHTKQIISTVWKTAFEAYSITNNRNAQLLSFVQGYESYFENGTKYGAVELSYKLADGILTVSKYLQNELKSVFYKKSHVIPNGINLDLIRYTNDRKIDMPTVTIIMWRILTSASGFRMKIPGIVNASPPATIEPADIAVCVTLISFGFVFPRIFSPNMDTSTTNMIGHGSDEAFSATNIDEQVRMIAPMTPIMRPRAVNWALKGRLPSFSGINNTSFRIN